MWGHGDYQRTRRDGAHLPPLRNWAAKGAMPPLSHPNPSGGPTSIWAKQDSKDQSIDLCLHGKRASVTAVTPPNRAALSPVNNLSDELQPAFVK